MPLSSQNSRTGLSRHYRSRGGQGRSRRWPWIAMVAGLVGVVGVIQWLGDSEAQSSLPEVAQAAAPVEDSPVTAGVSTASPAPSAAVTPPPVPTLTVGGDRQPSAGAGTGMGTAAGTGAATSPAATTVSTPARVSAAAPPPAGASYDASRTSSANAATALAQGMELIADGRLVEGRRLLSELLFARAAELSPADAQTVRDTLASINKEMVFSPKVFPGDPVAEAYRVQPGDYLSKIALGYHVPYPLLEMINRIEARRLQAGQTIKAIKGPFHARVVKTDYRMDLYLKEDGATPIYVTSLPVGLGESDSTPLGSWIVERGRKVKNPAWSNPRTSEYYAADDPANPIGEYWLALKGTSPETEGLRGYGIHGTIEPESVGTQRSMGCVRLRDADIELVFKMLEDGQSTVEIVR